ncbi:DUF3306 domain-containing protein [Moritella sp. F3]|uniref:DUF3306 domain-containing protein n=1 Tax=Moritella sp. F3 TaxID=2718882 RepID=UPI0018E13ED7|nr:DUF3306 domain-containing protein [Moritella sp. F3]GIC76456.1 hypothetical protein FMO001_11830 [Moritella sp. F1]GIC80875.1 hypothetical protein FMO003_11560 [Moritella sp. F3]
MASNFFQRWSDRSLAAKDPAETDLVVNKDAVVETENQGSELTLKRDAELDIEHISAPTPESAADLELSTGVIDEQVEAELTIDDADKVTFDSGVASFLQHGVDKSVKKAALAKLFHADEFNYISDMDDHTEDFSNIPKLDESIAKQLRGWVKTVLEEPEAELVEDTELVEGNEVLATTETEPETGVIVDPQISVDETTQSITTDNSSTSYGGEKNCGSEQQNQFQAQPQQTSET